jgi:hypothetical protein
MKHQRLEECGLLRRITSGLLVIQRSYSDPFTEADISVLIFPGDSGDLQEFSDCLAGLKDLVIHAPADVKNDSD